MFSRWSGNGETTNLGSRIWKSSRSLRGFLLFSVAPVLNLSKWPCRRPHATGPRICDLGSPTCSQFSRRPDLDLFKHQPTLCPLIPLRRRYESRDDSVGASKSEGHLQCSPPISYVFISWRSSSDDEPPSLRDPQIPALFLCLCQLFSLKFQISLSWAVTPEGQCFSLQLQSFHV